MTIRTRIYVLLAMIVATVLAVSAVAYLSIRFAAELQVRAHRSNERLAAVARVQIAANHFSENIAELLLLGASERPAFERARTELDVSLKHLEEVMKRGPNEQEREALDETHRVVQLRRIFTDIEQAASQVILLKEQGQRDQAVSLFRVDIENRFDREMDTLLENTALDELEEVNRAKRASEALSRWLTFTTTISAVVAIFASLVSGLLLARMLTRPIDLLEKGAKAIGQGHFSHRIDYKGKNELGKLAQRFNEMASKQEEQRRLLLHAQVGLEREVSERTAELAAANKRLTDLDRLRVRFLADISHELRTPLTALRGEAEITLRRGPHAEIVYRDALERITSFAIDMGRFIEDLLFIARSEADSLRFEMRRINLQDVVAEAVREGQALSRSKSIRIDVRLPHQVPVHADPQRLKQAVTILLDNAIKYSPAGQSVWVEVAAANNHGEVIVRNEGAGIPAEDLPHVFERFYRGSVSGQTGSGLGLAIAKWIIEKHGGAVAVLSEERRFTEVRLRIPSVKDV